ncbi:MAG: 3-hydroxybutyryl-CoA dehydrogenase [Chitinophagales bacterium]|nr:3-hydroxybutyryl-CoA dehydrogenase [Chitinophagales bacterium]
MTISDIKTIGVAGAGTMGAGIAQVSAMAGYNVILFDVQEEALKKAASIIANNLDGAIKRGKIDDGAKAQILSRISYSTNITDLIGQIIIEAIIENLEIKLELFSKIASNNTADTILASNTSTIPITQIAAGIENPERVVGMHFFNPVHIMKLVEVISGAKTSAQNQETVKQLAEKLGKKAVYAKDAPGFIVNRVARHFYVESLKVAEDGVADFESIDKLVRSIGFKMGPFQLMDLIGVDTNYSVTESMYNLFNQDSKFRPNRIQKQKVDAGEIGRKSGKGFYDYSE